MKQTFFVIFHPLVNKVKKQRRGEEMKESRPEGKHTAWCEEVKKPARQKVSLRVRQRVITFLRRNLLLRKILVYLNLRSLLRVISPRSFIPACTCSFRGFSDVIFTLHRSK